jgi:hypothetical protein
MDVTAEFVFVAQRLSHGDQLLHRVIGALDNTGAEKKPFDVISFVKLDRKIGDLLRRKSGTWSVAGDPIYAVLAVVHTIVR